MKRMKKKPEISVILADIRSSHNVGSIFRTSDALGISKIYLTGYTPAPKDQFGRINKEIAKVALGAEETILWESAKSLTGLLTKLQKQEIEIVSLEQSDEAIDYKKFKIKKDTAFILGNEVDGVSKSVLAKSNTVIYIPMRGEKESLNVSVAFGIALARILNL